MIDILERLRHPTTPAIYSVDVNAMREAADEISRLRQICRDAYEVWAGSEGFPQPTTASEAYVLQQLCLMRDEVKKGL